MINHNLNRGLAAIVVALAGSIGCDKNIHKEEDYLQSLYVASSIEYKKDKNDYWQTPNETRRLKTGDCEDMAILLVDEWKKRGIEGRLVFGFLRKDSEVTHAWCEIMYKRELYVVDPTCYVFIPKKSVGKESYIRLKDWNYIKRKRKELRQRIRRGE